MTARAHGSSPSQLLQYSGWTLLTATAVLLVLLTALPDGEPVLADTVSSAAYGAHGAMVFAILLTFGLATASFAVALGLRLGGRAGQVCGALVGVWSVAALFDAFVKTTSRAHTGTSFSQVHTLAAVAGIAAQLLVAITYALVVRRRLKHVPAPLVAVTTVVLAGVAFVIVHPDELAGLSERMLLAASAAWMLVSVRVAPPASTAGRAPKPGPAQARR